MYRVSGTDRPWLRRVDHLICEVPDIEAAMALFTTELGFPEAWPVGRFWPQGRTSGVALGGLNLEFLQLDEGAPEVARIRTVVFEPTSLADAQRAYADLRLPMELREKWEPDPELLRLRGFGEETSLQPQLICQNLIPAAETPIDFFLCEYAPALRSRLGPEGFPGLSPVIQIEIALREPDREIATLESMFGLPQAEAHKIVVCEKPSEAAEVVAIRTERGPVDFGGWSSRFNLV